MKFLFEDESFSFETLRAAGFANYGGADLGEVIMTAAQIPEGDEDAWLQAWSATAKRIAGIAQKSLEAGQVVSAREAFLRASNYYRTSEFFRRAGRANDALAAEISSQSTQAFRSAAKLLGTPFEVVNIPYEGTSLPGYLFLVDGSGKPRPTIIYNNGFDSTQEEAYFAIGAAALARGYNVLTFDGPGQGDALRLQGLTFRPDWEAVITPVLNFAAGRREFDARQLVLFGYSMGGYLVARGAAFDQRPAALILDDGILDFYQAFRNIFPAFLLDWIESGQDDRAIPVLKMIMATKTSARWALQNGAWTFGAPNPAEFIRRSRAYTLKGIVQNITSPTLILDAENDLFLKGEPEALHAALTCPNDLVLLTKAEGAGEHCHMGAMARMHQVTFDWLANTLNKSKP